MPCRPVTDRGRSLEGHGEAQGQGPGLTCICRRPPARRCSAGMSPFGWCPAAAFVGSDPSRSITRSEAPACEAWKVVSLLTRILSTWGDLALSKRDPSEVAMAELVRMAERAGVLAAKPHDSAGL